MQLFRLHTSSELLIEYVRENYISIDVPWLEEDVEFVQWEQLCAAYEQAANCKGLRLFVYEMQDSDLIIATDGIKAYLGDLGDYYFVEAGADAGADLQKEDPELSHRQHRRGVTWLKSFSLEVISEQLRPMMQTEEGVVKYESAVTLDEVERMLAGQAPDHPHAASIFIDEETIRESIEVLKQALRSEDADRRERAAIALLTFAKQ